MPDFSLYRVDLDTPQPNGRLGESPRAAFTKYNDLLDALGATVDNVGLVEPTSPQPYQVWIDTSVDPALIKRRNADNTGWVTIGEALQTFGTAASLDTGTAAGEVPTNGDLAPMFDARLPRFATVPTIYVGDLIAVDADGRLYQWDSGSSTYLVVVTAAGEVSYDNSASGLVATDAQAAIDELSSGSVPVGTIIDFAGSGTPAGFLLCPTTPTTVSRTTYARLFAVIGTLWGAGDGSTTFGIPYFENGYTAVSWPSNPGGTTQGVVQSHVHGIGAPNAAASVGGTVLGHNSTTGGATGQSGDNMAAGRGVRKCIRY